ncbi:dTDP-4-dehydrorhamnose 3,5-epimerase [Campylobacter troglodytis]|uniref:dTDP-4-dehydrorhamnose 3,5-epimerase n=1 Tax=Campylobacter troglodytis TaxID=654363 RepID=UPI001159F914|nr:dTDP-4-dehydrorhamnose 3,5-epimerase [Campylobacter troglodytis]TQR60306.1 dTDP-4-dehydrorhamnose 3,5-epimerase [Campylobacter troglodytis]
MNFIKTKLEGVVICEPKIHADERGYFVETFRLDELEKFTQKKWNFVQDNESLSQKGVLRGLHFQLPPFAQSKLLRVIKGRVLDVALDIRKNSPTFGEFVAVELSGENKRQILLPQGFAHGFLVLENDTIFAYKVDNYYSKECDRGILWNDSKIAINWGDFYDLNKIILSQKDKTQPLLSEVKELL